MKKNYNFLKLHNLFSIRKFKKVVEYIIARATTTNGDIDLSYDHHGLIRLPNETEKQLIGRCIIYEYNEDNYLIKFELNISTDEYNIGNKYTIYQEVWEVGDEVMGLVYSKVFTSRKLFNHKLKYNLTDDQICYLLLKGIRPPTKSNMILEFLEGNNDKTKCL